ncbi:MAG: TolC family protein [Verrucomicrobiota bacterium]
MNRRPNLHRLLVSGLLIFGSLAGSLPALANNTASDFDPSKGLDGYLRRALAENPGLKAFEQRYEAAMSRIPQASALPDPTLQITHFVESVQTRTGPQENVLMLSQKIPWFGKLANREASASTEAEALWHAYRNQQLMLARSVALAYFEYGYTGEAIRLTRENLDLLRELEPIVEEKIRAGSSTNPLLRLKVEVAKVDDRLRSLARQRVAQSARLSELLALPDESPLPWPEVDTPEPASPDGTALAAALRAGNPELRMLERKIASAEARRELARLERYPDVTLGVNYIQVGEPKVMPATPDAGQDPWGVTVAINLPIRFAKYDAAKAEALAHKRSAESEYHSRRNALLAELTSSLATLEDANRRLDLYGDELLGLARQAVENSSAAYQSGQTGILEVIDSERSLLDLQLLYERAIADAWQQRIRIQTLTGQGAGNDEPANLDRSQTFQD